MPGVTGRGSGMQVENFAACLSLPITAATTHAFKRRARPQPATTTTHTTTHQGMSACSSAQTLACADRWSAPGGASPAARCQTAARRNEQGGEEGREGVHSWHCLQLRWDRDGRRLGSCHGISAQRVYHGSNSAHSTHSIQALTAGIHSTQPQ